MIVSPIVEAESILKYTEKKEIKWLCFTVTLKWCWWGREEFDFDTHHTAYRDSVYSTDDDDKN